MKLYFFILMTFCISFFSCKKENTPSVPLVIKTDNGPNLDVWVSELGIPNANYVNLGDLKSTNGDFIYKTPKVGNITAYPNLLIWCADFDVRFGYAVFDL
ncbi:MAG: DM13 domain-containing protein [Bacteroidetes bacterium]|nr:DM13 domain-containing protein [Bacteroidota bacterium]